MNPDRLAAAARALVGTRFRPRGRDPSTGLDCVGVLAAAFSACGVVDRLPRDYPLRHRRAPETGALAAGLGLVACTRPPAAGDVLMLRVDPLQFHFAIATGPATIVHAHAALQRVVEGPLPAGWPLAGQWRAAIERT